MAEARRNEIAAHHMAFDNEVIVTGNVAEIGFMRTERKVTISEWRANSSALSTGGVMPGAASSSSGRLETEQKRFTVRTAFVRIEAKDATVLCFVSADSHVDALSVGKDGRVAGLYSEFDRDSEGRFTLALTSCRVPE